MSTPKNSLDKFRSYRYYHVLAICDSTATAEALGQAGLNDPSVWLHAEPSSLSSSQSLNQYLGKYGVKEISLQQSNDKDSSLLGRYCILINGSTDADLVITNAKWTGFTAANATPGDFNTSNAVEGSITISEPRGVIFADLIVLCCQALNVDASTAVFCLKTFFVGYATNEQTNNDEGITVINVEPLIFLAIDFTATYSETGGVYELTFVAMANGAARLPQYSRLSDGFTLNLQKNNDVITIEDAIQLFSEKVEENYRRYYSCIRQYLEANAQTIVSRFNSNNLTENNQLTVEDYLNRFSPVKYEFVVDDAYKKYLVNDFIDQMRTQPGCDNGGTIIFLPGTSIEDALRQILLKSTEIQKEMKVGVKEGTNQTLVKYEPKIQSCVKTRNIGTGLNSRLEVVVVYSIRRFFVPKAISVESLFFSKDANLGSEEKQTTTTTAEIDPRIRENIIEFDYIYSGQNIDILEFDIKMNLGLSYLQAASISNTLLEQFDQLQGKSIHISQNNPNVRFGNFIPSRIPIFFGTHMRSPALFNSNAPSSAYGAQVTLATHASLELMDATVKIRGNFRLLNSLNVNSLPSKITTQPQPLFGRQPGEQLEEADFPHWGFFPAFAKINIWMPSSNDDRELFESSFDENVRRGNVGYARRFWFNGYYYVYQIDHEFNEGNFTQTLHMLAIPPKTPQQNIADSVDRVLGKCFEGNLGVINSTTSTAPQLTGAQTNNSSTSEQSVPFMPTTSSMRVEDVAVILNSRQSLSDVVGWNKKHPQNTASDAQWMAAKEAIIRVSQEKNLNPVMMARFASIESRIDPIVKASSSSAVGLYQFLNNTWLDYARRTTIPGVPKPGSGVSDSDILQKRTDPEASAHAMALLHFEARRQLESIGTPVYETDYYMAHLLGVSGAKFILQQIQKGKGHQPLSISWPYGAWADKVKANPKLLSLTDTPHTVRSRIATEYAARTLIGGLNQKQGNATLQINAQNGSTATATQHSTTLTITEKLSQVRDIKVEQIQKNDFNKKKCGTLVTNNDVESIDVVTSEQTPTPFNQGA